MDRNLHRLITADTGTCLPGYAGSEVNVLLGKDIFPLPFASNHETYRVHSYSLQPLRRMQAT